MAVENHPLAFDGTHYVCIEAQLCECECDSCYVFKKRVLRWILDKEEYEELYGEGSWKNWWKETLAWETADAL